MTGIINLMIVDDSSRTRLALTVGVLALVQLTACATPSRPTPTQQAGIANPASIYCEETGYRSEIRTSNDGIQSGVCIFPDGSECDEWAHFRGECGPADHTSSTTSIPSDTWVKLFEGPDYGAFFDAVLTRYGNILVVGATNHLHVAPYSGDALFMMLTLDGGVLWEKTWGGEGYEQAWSIVPANGGGYLIFGETDSFGAGDRDFFLLKITEDGSEEWFQTYGKANREWPYGMIQLQNGDFLLHGLTESLGGGGRDQYALRVGRDGDLIWEYVSGGPEDEVVLDALETSDGDLILAVGVAQDGMLVKLDAEGNVIWENHYRLPGWQYATQVAETDDGGYFLVGFSMGSAGLADIWSAKCNSTGELEWEKAFGDPNRDDYATRLVQRRDGTYLLGGIAHGVLLGLLDKNGDLLWLHYLVGQGVYGSPGLLELEDGGFLVAGFIQITGGRSYDAILLRTDLNGQINK